MFPEAAAFVIIFTCLFFIARLYIVVKNRPKHKAGAKGRVAVLVVAGSGGHTTEILRLTECLSAAYAPRHYVIADTDQMSEEKICTFERSRQRSDSETQFTICRIPRSREVHQSWTSSVVSTLKALQYSVPLVFRLRPDVPHADNTQLQTRRFLFHEKQNNADIYLVLLRNTIMPVELRSICLINKRIGLL
ncbi:hypothetical protein F2P81_019489 [Scophthalmus maximus]|uniref:UDP-N-acetylglucosamine transferase subunit ALG14 n=1 Tax=Scophthalmus maximus TaxID=52904 RepID=A0A6A4SCT4_SCOMX|nr:hypothetical protein F2P81_019489 [Scophthalmus maximus]